MKLRFITAFIMLTSGAFAQEIAKPAFAPADFKITTRLSQFLFKNFNVTVERSISRRQTLGLTLEYRPGSNKTGMAGSMFGPWGPSYYLTHFNSLYNGATMALNSKYYLVAGRSLYIDAVAFYRRWWFDNQYVSYDMTEPPGLRFAATRTEQLNIYGIKALFGRSFVKRTKSLVVVFDLFAGVGLRYRRGTYETFNGTIKDVYYTYHKETTSNWAPTIQGGFQLGIGK